MRKDSTVRAPFHPNDSMHLLMIARHPNAPVADQEKMIRSLRSESAKRVAKALFSETGGRLLRNWALQNPFLG